VFPRREAKASEVTVHVAHRSAPGAHQVMVGARHGVEASGACPHVELLDLT
jgi:predicted deacylase